MFRQTLPRGFSRLGSLRSPYLLLDTGYFLGSRNLGWWSRKLDRAGACEAGWLWFRFSFLLERQLESGAGTPSRFTGRADQLPQMMLFEQRKGRPSGRLWTVMWGSPRQRGVPFRKGRALYPGFGSVWVRRWNQTSVWGRADLRYGLRSGSEFRSLRAAETGAGASWFW